MALVDRLLMPTFLLSTLQSIRLHPGETQQAASSCRLVRGLSRPAPW
jgi:hypothetical protein